jgi:hypothetical protein
MILITVAPVGYRGSWSASIDDRVICPSVRWPFVSAAKALLAEGHAPDTEIAMKHEGSTIVALHGKIGTLATLTDDAPTSDGPSPPHTGSQGGDLDAERRRPFLSPFASLERTISKSSAIPSRILK